MKKFIIAAIALMGSFSAKAQEAKFGFETNSNWWVHANHRPYVSLSKEQAAEGSQSLKFECMNFDGFEIISTNMPVHATNIASLPAGDYTMKVDVYLGEKAPTGFTINFKETQNSKYISTVWNATKLEKGKWIEMSQDVTLEQTSDIIFAIHVRNVRPWKGVGTLYVDNIRLIKK